MSSLDELPLSTSAYIADTQHLSLPQHGAYLLILMTMWRARGWIDDDDRKLATICKTTVKKWRQIAPDIRALLTERDGRLSQKRLLSEVGKVLKTVAANKLNGGAGGRAKALKSKTPRVATATGSLDDRQEPSKPPLTSFPKDLEIQKQKKGKGGISLPADWIPSDDAVAYGENLGLTKHAIDGMAEDMRLWAQANSNRAVGRKADWTATFKSWMRREAAKRGGSNGKAGNGGGARGGGYSSLAARIRANRPVDGGEASPDRVRPGDGRTESAGDVAPGGPRLL